MVLALFCAKILEGGNLLIKKNKLDDMELKSVDLCHQGANQFSKIKLYKSSAHHKEGDESKMSVITKAAGAAQVRDTTTALRKSFESIMSDDSLTSVEKRDMMEESLQQFTDEASELMESWADAVGKMDDADPDFDPEDGPEDDPEDQEDEDNMEKSKSTCSKSAAIDIGKMSPDDRAIWESLQKKYGATNDGDGDQQIHPDVKKAIEEVAELRKSMELEKLENFAKKYEVIGKKAPELAQKLYELRQIGEQHYNDYVALLDEQLNTANAGIFKEFGTSRSSTMSDLNSSVTEILKSNPSMTREQAVIKAFEINPNLDPFTGRMK